MNTILLPIRKEYSDRIFDGSKLVEYRKSKPSKRVEKILVYESRGCGMIVGELEVLETIVCQKEELWSKTYEIGGVDKDEFDDYFSNRQEGVGYSIGKVIKYELPLPLSHYGVRRAPQNYIWIK